MFTLKLYGNAKNRKKMISGKEITAEYTDPTTMIVTVVSEGNEASTYIITSKKAGPWRNELWEEGFIENENGQTTEILRVKAC